jgi:CxxC motif-containing protein
MNITCINCPRGCQLLVERQGEEVVVTGNACPRGGAYGTEEFTNPKRMVTALVKLAGTHRPLPVKTKEPVPKSVVLKITEFLGTVTVMPPKRIGDVIVPDVCGTGVDIVATANIR